MKKNVNTNTNTNTDNRNEVVNMNNNVIENVKTSALAVGGNSVDDIKATVNELVKSGYTANQAVEGLFLANTLNESNVKMQKAKIYAGISGNAELMKKLNVTSMSELSERYELGDSKATISEMIGVYRYCFDKPCKRLSDFIKTVMPTYTELVKIVSVSAGKGSRTDDERYKDIELFLNEYAPNNIPAWSKVSELRDFVTAFKSPTTTAKDTKPEPKPEPKTEPKSDYTAIKSVADTSKKEATSAIKQAKADGDIIENKAKGITIVNADSVSDFMTKLVNIAKIRGCKPLELVGEITMTLKDGE